MSFKLFIISVAKLRNKIENAETKREKCWSKREKSVLRIDVVQNICLTVERCSVAILKVEKMTQNASFDV